MQPELLNRRWVSSVYANFSFSDSKDSGGSKIGEVVVPFTTSAVLGTQKHTPIDICVNAESPVESRRWSSMSDQARKSKGLSSFQQPAEIESRHLTTEITLITMERKTAMRINQRIMAQSHCPALLWKPSCENTLTPPPAIFCKVTASAQSLWRMSLMTVCWTAVPLGSPWRGLVKPLYDKIPFPERSLLGSPAAGGRLLH